MEVKIIRVLIDRFPDQFTVWTSLAVLRDHTAVYVQDLNKFVRKLNPGFFECTSELQAQTHQIPEHHGNTFINVSG